MHIYDNNILHNIFLHIFLYKHKYALCIRYKIKNKLCTKKIYLKFFLIIKHISA